MSDWTTEAPKKIEFRRLEPDEIVTPECAQQIDGNFIGVFTFNVPASAYENPIYKRQEPTA